MHSRSDDANLRSDSVTPDRDDEMEIDLYEELNAFGELSSKEQFIDAERFAPPARAAPPFHPASRQADFAGKSGTEASHKTESAGNSTQPKNPGLKTGDLPKIIDALADSHPRAGAGNPSGLSSSSEETAQVICPVCGARTDGRDMFCISCGSFLE